MPLLAQWSPEQIVTEAAWGSAWLTVQGRSWHLCILLPGPSSDLMSWAYTVLFPLPQNTSRIYQIDYFNLLFQKSPILKGKLDVNILAQMVFSWETSSAEKYSKYTSILQTLGKLKL